METAILILLVLLLGGVVVLIGMGRRIAEHVDKPSAVLQSSRNASRGRLIVIEIRNPLEVAASQHWVAGIAGSVAPALVTKMVYDRAAKMMAQELGIYGVDAMVEVQSASTAPVDGPPPMRLVASE